MPSVDWNKDQWSRDIVKFQQHDRGLPYYGAQWYDPELSPVRRWFRRNMLDSPLIVRLLRRITGGRLKFAAASEKLHVVVEDYIFPYVSSDTAVLEIGPGGGRFTQYMLNAKSLILVDLVPEFFPYLKERFSKELHKISFYETAGNELNGIDDQTIDFLFTFDAFVHVDAEDISLYLSHINRVLRNDGFAVIHYSDKTKKDAAESEVLSDMTAASMTEMLGQFSELKIIDHNLTLINTGNIVVLQKTQQPDN